MKNIFLFACLIISFGTGFAQKVKSGKDEFVFDKKAGTVKDLSGGLLFTITYERNVSANVIADDYYFKNNDGKTLIVFKYSTFKDPRMVSSSNSDGRQSYYEIKFFTEPISEAECSFMFLKDLVAMVYRKQLISNGALNEEKVREFIAINGSAFSRRRAELGRY